MARRLALGAFVLVAAACSAHNNVFLGEVRAELDGHPVLVTDCYRLSAPSTERVETTTGPEFRWSPCRDAIIVIREDVLTVNGKSYGKLAHGKKILVDHGKVTVE